MNIHSPDLISGSSMMSSLQAVELPFRRRPSLASHHKAVDVCSGTLVTRSGNLVNTPIPCDACPLATTRLLQED
jgi:hypothetical protein